MLAPFRQWFVVPLLWCGVGLGGLLISAVVGHFHPGLLKVVPVDLSSQRAQEIQISVPTRTRVEVEVRLKKRSESENTSDWKRPKLRVQTSGLPFTKNKYEDRWGFAGDSVGFNYGSFVAQRGEEVIVTITPESGVQIPRERQPIVELREYRPDWSSFMLINYSAQTFGAICLLIGVICLVRGWRVQSRPTFLRTVTVCDSTFEKPSPEDSPLISAKSLKTD